MRIKFKPNKTAIHESNAEVEGGSLTDFASIFHSVSFHTNKNVHFSCAFISLHPVATGKQQSGSFCCLDRKSGSLSVNTPDCMDL